MFCVVRIEFMTNSAHYIETGLSRSYDTSGAKCGILRFKCEKVWRPKVYFIYYSRKKQMDSKTSVSSASSTNKEKIPCPHCNKDFGKRYMFSHIRSKHQDEFFEEIGMWVRNADPEEALVFWWNEKDDFDEDKEVKLYACLSTNKTFLTGSRATCHFKADKKIHKDHTKQMKALQKKYSDKKKREDDENPWKKGLLAKDSEMGIAMLRRIMYLIPFLEMGVAVIKNENQDDSPLSVACVAPSDTNITPSQLEARFMIAKDTFKTYIKNKMTDPTKLMSLYSNIETIRWTCQQCADNGAQYAPINDTTSMIGTLQGNDKWFIAHDTYPMLSFQST